MIRACSIIFGCLGMGELIVYFTGIKLPSAIIGMLVLVLFLLLNWVKLSCVKGISDFFAKTLPFYFIPSGVGVMMYYDLIRPSLWAIVTASLASTLLVFWLTGWVHQVLVRTRKRGEMGLKKH